MSDKNFSWGILSFATGLVLSLAGILTLALMQVSDPVAYGTLATVANGCLVGLGSVMNPNRKFDSDAQIAKDVKDVKDLLQ